MTKKNTTKKALIASLLALALCFSMLVGTTFAWFTDSAVSSGNIIKTGKLDVEMYWADGTLDPDAATWTNAKDGAIFNYDKWEPGYTEVRHIKIENAGDLALKYAVSIVADGEVGNLADAIDVYFVDPAVAVDEPADLTEQNKLGALSAALSNLGSTGNGTLLAGETDVITIALKMREGAGNEYMDKSIGATFSVQILATQFTAESDSFDNQYDKDAVIVSDKEAAQAALDNAVPGTTLFLLPGVDYGVLYMRPSDNADVTKVVDWVGNNYGHETYSLFENVTIVGAEGATVDAIEIEGGTYYYTDHSQADEYPVMLSLIELKNVVFDGVTFTGNGGRDPQGYGNAVNLSGNNIKVDGLTFNNCVLENKNNDARLLYKTESTDQLHNYDFGGESFTFKPTLKDITVTGCTFNGGYMGLELRETENLTVTNNEFKVADRNILLPANTGFTYSGTVTITGNKSVEAKERFVRADGMGDATVIIKDNEIKDYMGADKDYIKVTNANNVTVENNAITYAAKDSDTFAYALKNAPDGSTVTLLSGGEYSCLALPSEAAKNITVKAESGVKVGAICQRGCGYCVGGIIATPENLVFENVTFDGAVGKFVSNEHITCGHLDSTSEVLSGFVTRWSKVNGLTFKGCEFVNGAAISISYGGSNDVVVDGCTFIGTEGNAVGVYGANRVTVKNCTMEDIGFAAIFAGDDSKDITFEGNTVDGTASRLIRLNALSAGSTVIVKGNTFGAANTDATEAAENNGQIVKISNSASAVVTFEDNTYKGAAFPAVETTDNANWFAYEP